jgi:cytochrome d ubiquinol oxidase subunit I
MDAVLLARIQFAMTIGFHFIFPPLSIGLAWLIVWFMGRYKKTSSQEHKDQARFWIRIFALTFAIGVATGITMEFQFGTNWAAYSRYVGDIFGAPLAAEGLLAFFLESTFMGVLLFGWKKLSAKALWVSALMVAVGATLSAFWIIVANSWMQTPTGYEIIQGRAVLTDFWAAVFNPSTLPRYFHVVNACLMTGAFFMLGISALLIRKDQHQALARRSFKVSLVLAFVTALAQLPLGHIQGVQLAETQPLKLAALEGVFQTRVGAPVHLFGIPDAENGRLLASIEVPKMLSYLAYGDARAKVVGLHDFPKEEWPPVLLSFTTFHLMVGLGLAFIGITALGIFLWWRKKLFEQRWFLGLLVLFLPLPTITNQLGWIAAEVGRQPWIVYGQLKTADAISSVVPAWQILASIIMFGLIYSLLFAVWIILLKRNIRKGPQPMEAQS